jgi:AcrR family transcriptional regulator
MGITERREREKEQRHNDILDAAERIFFGKGYSAATMDDIAAAAELSKGTIYLYFKTKEEVYFAITLRGLKILTELSLKASAQGRNGLEKVFLIGRAFLQFSKEYPNYFNALAYYEIKETEVPACESEAAKCDDAGNDALEILVEALKTGIEDGSIRQDIDPRTMAIILWGQTSGVIQVVALKGDHFKKWHGVNMDSIVDAAFHMIRCELENK